MSIAYNGEQWRLGATSRVDRLDFEYSVDATDVTGGTWINVDSLDFTAPLTTGTVGARNGNVEGRVPIASSITSLNIPNGATFWIRWRDFNPSGSDDGLAIDDFSLTSSGPANSNPTISNIADGQSTRSYQPISFTYTVGDNETPLNDLQLTGVSSNQSIVPNSNIVVTGTGATRTVTVTPIVATTTAPITVTMTVRDGGNATAVDTFTLNVTQAPTLSIDKLVARNPGQSFSLPVRLNTNGVPPSSIQGIDMAILYDTNVLTLNATPVLIGGGLVDFRDPEDPEYNPAFGIGVWSLFGNGDVPGQLSISISTTEYLTTDFNGVIAVIRGTVKSTAPPGVSPVNLVKSADFDDSTVVTWINEDRTPSLLLGPDPTAASNDPVSDGSILVGGAAGQSPVNTVPVGPVSGTEDTNLALSGANLISVADGDSASVTTTVSVPNTAAGTFTATSGGGTVTPAFSNGNATVTFTGAPAQVNLALATLTFVPAANRNSTDGTLTVSVSTTDSTTTPDNDSFTISLTPINDAPSFTASNPAAVNEDVNGGVVNVPGFITSFSAGPTNEGAAGQTALNYLVSNLVNSSLFSVAPTVATNGTLSYTLAPNAFGTATFDLRVQDNGGTAGGGVDTSLLPAQTITITVDPVNDAPSFTAGTSVTVPYNSSAYSASNWATNRSFGPANETGQTLSFVVLNDNTNLFDVQPAVSPAGTLTFTPKANTSGTANVTVRIVDTGGVLNGGVDTSVTQAFTITISPPANVAPVNTFPLGPVSGTEDTNLPLSGANLISVTDDSASVTTTVSVPSTAFGTFTATSGGGSVTPAFSNGGATVTFTGAPAQVNLALATLTFVPAAHRNSTDGTLTVSVATTDGTLSDSDSFNISLTAVNDPPSFTASNPAAVNEDASGGVISVPGFITSFSPGPANEVTAGQTVLNYLVSNVTNGTMFLVAPSVATNGTLSYTLAPNAFGTATFDLRVQDSGGTAGGGIDTSLLPAQTITITVNPVNDAPTFDIGNVSTRSFTPVTTAFTVADVEDVNGVSFSVVSSSNPTAFPVGNITFGGSGTNRTVTVTPAVGFSTPTTTTITVRATDAGGQTTDDTFVVTLTPAPTLRLGSVAGKAGDLIQVPILLSTNSTLSPGVLGIDIAVLYDTNYLQLLPTSPPGPGPGPVSPGGAGITAVGDGNDPGKIGVSIGLDTPIMANVSNFQLGFLNFMVKATAPLGVTPVNMVKTAVISGSTVTTEINEGFYVLGPEPTSASNDPQNDGAVTVNAGTNNAPVNSFPVSPVVGFEDANLGLAVTVSDANAGQNFVSLTVSVPSSTFGTLVTSPTASTAIVNSANGGASLTITGVEDQVNLVLGTLQFVPAANRNSDDGLITVTVQSNDTITTTTDNFQISLTPINDAPSFQIGGNQTVVNNAGEQTVANFATLISRGPTNEAGQSVSFTRTSANSPLFSVQPAIAANGTLTYTPAPGQTGVVTVTFTMSDDGGTANGGINTTGPQSFTITVNAPANVSPVNTFPAGPVTGLEDTNLPLTGANLISVADDSASVTTTVAVANNNFGTFLATSGGGSVTPAFSNGGATVTFTGSPAQVNLALATLTFVPALHRNLSDGTLTVSVTSTDGATTPDNDSFNISLTAVNDAPTFTAGTPPTILEDMLTPQSVPGFITAYSNGPANENLQALQGYLVSNISNAAFFATAPAVSNAGTLTYTLNPNVFGTVTFDLRAQDNGLTANSGVDTSAPQQITITVTGVNDAPSITLGTAPAVLEDAVGTQSVPGFVTSFNPGPNESGQVPQSYQITNVSNPGLFASGPAIAANGTLTYTLNPNANGTATFDVRVVDDGGTLNSGVNTSVAAVQGTINVTAVNDAPSFTHAGHQSVAFNSPAQTVNGFITAFSRGPSDESGQTVTYTVTNDLNSLFSVQPAISPAGVLTYTPMANTSGTAVVSVRIVDSGGVLNGGVNTSAIQTFNITVNSAVNTAPTNSFPAGPIAGFEDTNIPLTGPNLLSVADDSAAVTTVVSVPNSTFGTFTGNEGGGTVTMVFSNGNSSVTIIGPANQVNLALATLVYVPVPNFSGNNAVVVTMSTSDGTFTDTDSFTINLAEVNDAPSFTKGTNPTVNEDAGAQSIPGFITSFSPGPSNEASQGVQAYTVANLTGAALFAVAPTVASNGTLSYTLNSNVSGVATFELRVRDNGGTADGGVDISPPQIVTITVNAVNDAPTFSAAMPPTILEDAGPQSVSGFITAFSPGPGNDSGQTIQAYQVSNISLAGFFSSPPTVSNGGVLQYTVAANVFGTVTFDLRAQDNGGTANSGVDTSAPQTITITVTGVNDAPSFTAGAAPTILEDAGPQSVSGFITAFNPGPNEAATQAIGAYQVSNISIPSFFSSPPVVTNAGVLQYTVAANTFGSVTFDLRAQDNGGTANSGVDLSASQQITITVTGVNDAPTITLGTAPTVLEDAPGTQTVAGYVTSFNPGANESGQTAQSYLIGNISNPSLFASGPSIAPNGTLTYTLAANANGTSTFEVRGVDNGGVANGGADTSAIVTGTINVTPVNDAPSFTAGTPPTVLEDAAAQTVNGFITSFTAGPLNENGQAVQAYQVSNISNAAFFQTPPAVSNTGTLTYTLNPNVSGTVTFELRAQDNGGTANSGVDTSAPQTITITVTGVNDAPSFTAGTPPTILEDAGPQTVNGVITAFNAGLNESSQTIQAYLVSNISNPSFFSSPPVVSNAGVLQYTVAPNVFGTVTFELRAQDNGGTANSGVDTSAAQTITINVTGVNDAPSIILGVAPAVLEDAAGPQTVPGYITGFNPGPNEAGQTVQNYLIANVSNPSLFASGPSIAADGTLSYTLAANANGASTFEIRVVDSGGTAGGGIDTSTPITGSINVTPVNDVPTFTVGPNQTVAYNASAQTVNGFIPTFSPGPANESLQTVSFTVTNDFNGLFTAGGQPAISPSGVLTYTPLANTSGTATVSVRIVDSGDTLNGGQNTSAIQTFTITVSEAPVNAPPTIDTPATVTILEDAGLQTVSLTGISAGGSETQALTITASSADPLIIPTPTVIYTSGTTGSLRFTPVPNAHGSTTITITVRDAGFDGTPNNSDDATRQVSFTVNVTAVNDIPTFAAGTPPTVLEDAPTQSLSGFITSFSPGPNEATQAVQGYLVSNISIPGFFAVPPAVSTAGTLTFTLAPNANGSVTFQLRAQDNGGTANGGVDTSAPQTITINVTPVNDAPSFTATNPPAISEDAPQQVINNFATGFSPGPANESIQGLAAYLVSNISNPAFFAVAPAVASNGTLTYTVAAGVSGTVTFELRAQDNGGTANGGIDTSPAQTITINVAGVNDAPSFTAGTPPTVLEDAPAQTVNGFITSFSPGAGESSQAIQAYLVSNISNPAFFAVPPAVSNTGTLTYTLAANANGTVTFELRAQDNGGTANGGVDTSAPQLITINVTPVNDAPTVTAITPPTVVEDAPQQVVSNFATFSPGPANEFAQGLAAFLVSSISNPAFFAVAPAVGSNGTLTYTLAPNMSGTVTFDLQAQDNGGTANGGVNTSAVQSVTITVNGVNDAPSFTAGTPPTVLEDAPAQTVNGFITSFSPGVGESSQAIQAYLISNVSNPAFFTVAPAVSNTGTLTYTLAPHVNGTVTFEVRAQDNGGTAGGGVDTSAPQTITLTVTPVNDAPSLTLGTAPTVLEDAAAQTVNGYVTSFSPGPNEGNQAIQSYTISNVSNPSLFASGPTIASNGSLSYTLAANANGSSTFEVRAVDNGGTASGGVNTSAPVIGTITVTPVNDAPSFALSASPSIAYNSPAQTAAGFATAISSGPANEAGQTLGFNVSVASNSSLFLVAPSIAPNGTLTYTPAADVSGTATINVSLTDNGGTASGGVDTSAVQQFTITIQPAPVNNPPTISSIGNVVISEDAGPQTVNFSGVTTGGETETLTITATSSDPTIVPNPSVTYSSPQATGSLNFTPVASANGTVTITVTVRDPGLDTLPGNSDDGITSTTFTVTVTPVNDLPSFNVGANQTVNEDSGLQTVNGWASGISAGPPNESSQVLTFNIVGNSNPTLFSAAPTISPTGELSYTPAPNANGTATISVTLSDNAGGTTGVQTFQITVNPVNDAPSFVVGANQSVSEDAGPQTVPNWVTSLSAGPADESSQSLTFHISGNSNPSLFSVQPTVLPNGTLSYTPAANATGTATITLNVSDNGGTANGGVDASGSQTFTISVNGVNDPPSFVAGPSQTVLEDAGPQTVNSWASGISAGPANEAGQTVSFNIVGISNPSLFSTAPAISPTGVLTYTPAPNANGSATITVSLSDNGGGTNTSPTQTFQISVTPVNDAPSFASGANQSVNEDAGPQTVPGWATALSAGPLDEAGQSLTFQVTGNTNPSLFASAPQVQPNGTLTYTPAANASGSATITLHVMDNGGTANGGVNASGSQTFTITVNAVNDPPSFVRGANQIVNEDAGPQTVSNWATSLSAGPANEAGQTLSFTVTNNTNTSLFSTQPAISPTGTLTYTPAAHANGTATISLLLSDSAGGVSAVQTFTITVQPVNDAPSFAVGPNQSTAEDSGTQTVSGWATGISAGPADEASQSLTFVVTGNTNAGLFAIPPSVTPAGTLSYTPAANASGSAIITLVLQDNGGTANGGVNTSNAQTFTISVTPVNDPPDATDSQFNTVVDTPVSGTVLVSDPDGPTLTYALQMLPVLGNVTSFNTSTGQFTYTPSPSATGLDLFTFSVTDGTTTDTATVRIVIGANTPIVIPSGGNLQVIGTGSRDTVIVSPGPAGQVQVRTDTGGVSSTSYHPLTGTISVSTGDGDDYVVVSGVTNATTVDAGSGNDYVSTGIGDDLIIGGTGDDRINASSGNNIVWGDEIGQQDLEIGGNDILSSLDGNDVMYGGGGDDQLYPGAGNDYVHAGHGHDLVSAGDGNDRIFGGAGNDTLAGSAGDDVVSGGAGNDYILGSDGNDVLIGGAGGSGDSLDGGGGNDLLIAGDTNNSVSSQAGDTNDVALMALLAAWNSTHASGIANGIVLGDDGASDSLTGGTGDDDFYALANDVLNNFNATNMGTDRRFP